MENPYVEDFNGVQHEYGDVAINSGNAPSGFGHYDKLFENNPYRNLNYKKSFWQAVAEGLGFRTSYDDRVEQAQLNAREFDADVFAMMREDQYNSETAKAQRMRDAGLNPDLLGTGDVSPSASMRNDANGVQFSQENEPAQVVQMGSSIAQGVLNLIPQVMSFATNITQLRGVRMDNDAKELSFGQDALGAVEDFFKTGISEQDYRDAFEKNDWTNVLDASVSNAKYLADTFLSSRKARKRFNLAYGMYSRSLMAKISKYQTYDDFEKARADIFTDRSHAWFNDDDSTQQALMKSFLVPIEQFNKKVSEINLRKANLRNPDAEQSLENMQIHNQQIYEQNIDASAQAQAENATNELTKQQNEITEATNQLFSDIMSNLSQNDNWWSKIAMALVGIARAQLMSGMSMHFQRQNYQKVDGNTGVVTEGSSSNLGASF